MRPPLIAAPVLDGRSWVFLLALSVLWSLSFIFVRVAGEHIPILTLVLIRVGLAAFVLHAVILANGRVYPRGGILLRYALMGLLNNVLPFALIVYATLRIGAGAAAILNATTPIFALLVAHVATSDERITAPKLAGILLGVAGVAAMVGPGALTGLTGEVAAALAVLAASFFYGLSALVGRGFRGVDPIVSAAMQLSASTLMLTPAALIVDRPWTLASPGAVPVAAAVALALVSTAIAYVLFFVLISRAGATNAVLVTLIIPVGGVLFGWLLLGEALAWGEAAGMLLIGLGLLVIDGRVLRRGVLRPA
jgi:drug/metabolite transporter (DMT)-like permease